MAVGNFPFPEIKPLAGLKFGIVNAGIRYKNRDDLLIVELNPGARVAGVFTQNAFAAAPVLLARKHLQESAGNIRYLVINAGNANACTGDEGLRNALSVCDDIAQSCGVSANQVLPFSTGVVGEQLPIDKFYQAIPAALRDLEADNWSRAGKAIMTTDTRPKGATKTFVIDGETITVSGIAKGVGMIKPNMATMLAFIATDAKISQAVLEKLVQEGSDKSFNCIVVDGDTSTNDSCMLMATGACTAKEITETSGDVYEKLREAIFSVFLDLSKNLICDGEGATKFVTVKVDGGRHVEECKKVAYAIAQSPLIKTALFASDPNWGRIAVAIGYAGVENLDPSLVNVHLGDELIVENGKRASTYTEEAGQAVMKKEDIVITVNLGRGDCSHRLWTTDFSYDYVKINADYRS